MRVSVVIVWWLSYPALLWHQARGACTVYWGYGHYYDHALYLLPRIYMTDLAVHSVTSCSHMGTSRERSCVVYAA